MEQLTKIIQEAVGSSYLEAEFVSMKIFLLMFSFAYMWVPKITLVKNSRFIKHLCLRKLVSLLVGLCLALRMMAFWTCVKFFSFTVLYYFVIVKYAIDAKSSFWVSIFGLIMQAVSALYMVTVEYGNLYPSHLGMIGLLVTPRLLYYVWQREFRTMGERGVLEKNEDEEAVRFVTSPQTSLLEYLCFVYFYPGFLAGPTVAYKEFRYFMEDDPTYRYKRTLKTTLYQLGVLLFSISLVIFESKVIDIGYLLETEYKGRSLVYKIYYCYVYFLFFRIKMVLIFTLAQLQNVILGLQAVDGHEPFDLLKSINFMESDVSLNIKTRIGGWNVAINRWLKTCFYGPSMEIFGFSKDKASLLTFGMSALWHGFYPSYYLSFVGFYLTLLISRSGYRLRGRLPGWLLFGLNVLNNVTPGISGVIFGSYTVATMLTVIRHNYESLVMMLVMYVVLAILQKVLGRKRKREEKKGDKGVKPGRKEKTD